MKQIFALALTATFALSACSGSSDVEPDASVNPSISANPADPDASNAPDASEYPGFNEEIKSDDVSFEVRNVTCGLASVGEEPVVVNAVGQFCLVRISVTNNTDDEYVFIGNDQVLYDNASTPYEMDASAAVFVASSKALGERIPVGETIEAILPYDVPQNAQLAGMLLKADATVDGQLMLFQNR